MPQEPNPEETLPTDMDETDQLMHFIASLTVSSQGKNIPDILQEIQVTLLELKKAIDVNSKCQLKLANSNSAQQTHK